MLQWPAEGALSVARAQELLLVDLARRQLAARAPDHRARADQLALVPAVEHRPAGQHDRRDVDGRGGHDRRRASSCRSRWSAPPRRSDSRTGSRPGRDRRGCGRAPRSAGGNSRRSDGPGIPSAMPPASRMPSRTRLASSRWMRLQGDRSLPVWAMPMIGRPERSSSGVMP